MMDDARSIKSVSTTASSSTKRKRAAEPKFYAVRVGYHPGIYYTWDDCKKQVTGFKNATCKSFSTLTDAKRFLAGENPSQSRGSVPPSPKFYAVKNGRVPGIYTDWTSAQDQITGWTKPRHKGFATRGEAQKFLDDGEELTRANATSSISYPIFEGSDEPPPTKKLKAAFNSNTKGPKKGTIEYDEANYVAGDAPLPHSYAEDGFDPNIILDPTTGQVVYKTRKQRRATKNQGGWGGQNEILRIHTDGSALRNGTNGALAGVGVYFGPGDQRNVSESLAGPRQTNQRAELTAILRALEIVPRNRDVSIITDSRYAIDCVTSWYVNWRKNGWKTSAGKSVENKDLVESVLGKIEERNLLGVQTNFEWIKGHANHPGNVEADKLAVNGAARSGI